MHKSIKRDGKNVKENSKLESSKVLGKKVVNTSSKKIGKKLCQKGCQELRSIGFEKEQELGSNNCRKSGQGQRKKECKKNSKEQSKKVSKKQQVTSPQYEKMQQATRQ